MTWSEEKRQQKLASFVRIWKLGFEDRYYYKIKENTGAK